MSKIHYFQRYTQKENVVTNNTLLLFSRLYNDSPSRFEDFINELLVDDLINVEIGLRFNQQSGNGKRTSIPDGAIIQKSVKVLIETKLYDNDSGQILRHLEGFDAEETQIMLLVNPFESAQHFDIQVNKLVNEYNQEHNQHIAFASVTFKQIIDAFASVLPDYHVEFKDMLDDFAEYCRNDGLLPRQRFEMRAVLSGDSFSQNMTHNIYYCPASRGYSPHNYIGLYKNKSIKGVGVLQKVIFANVDSLTKQFLKLEVRQGAMPTDEDKARILAIMDEAWVNNGWDIYEKHQFFVVEKFFPTNFKKITLYPILGTKFFDLGSVLESEQLPDCEEIAEQLKTRTWG
jgi:hypothetical protein